MLTCWSNPDPILLVHYEVEVRQNQAHSVYHLPIHTAVACVYHLPIHTAVAWSVSVNVTIYVSEAKAESVILKESTFLRKFRSVALCAYFCLMWPR